MDIKEHLTQNEQKLKELQIRLQLLQQETQQLLQEALRLDGEHRLLLEMQKEEAK